jgi:hypothetical protein
LTIELTKGSKTINLVKGENTINFVQPDVVYEIQRSPSEIVLEKHDKLVNVTQKSKKTIRVEVVNNNTKLADVVVQKQDSQITLNKQDVVNELVQKLNVLEAIKDERTFELIVDACVYQSLCENRYINCYCSAVELVGDCVYVYGPKIGFYYQVRKTDITDYSKMPNWGVVIEKKSPTECVVQWFGTVRDIFTSLIPGRIYFIDYDSRPIPNPPVLAIDHFAQKMGLALDTSTMLLLLDCNLVLRHNI